MITRTAAMMLTQGMTVTVAITGGLNRLDPTFSVSADVSATEGEGLTVLELSDMVRGEGLTVLSSLTDGIQGLVIPALPGVFLTLGLPVSVVLQFRNRARVRKLLLR